MSGLSTAVDGLRQPEYTGENRCIPCTAVNVAIAGIVSILVGLFQPLVAPPLFLVCLAVIYFRGYLVPGTPTLTKQYFPEWLLAKFDKAPARPAAPVDEEGGIDPEQVLLETGVVEPCADEDDLCLTDEIRERWQASVDDRRDGDRTAQVASFLEVDPGDVKVVSRDDAVVAYVDMSVVARWESDAALLADLGAVDALSGVLSNWDELGVAERSQLANGLRAFVETCPACGGRVSIDEETVESCCRSYDVFAATCEDCGARVLEVDQ